MGNENEAKGKEAEGAKPEEHVTIDASTYSALLDRLDELEASAGEKKGEEAEPTDPEERLARQASAAERKPVDLERMSNSQLANFIASELQGDVLQPLLIRVAQLELSIEEKNLIGKLGKGKTAEERDEIEDEYESMKPEVYKVLHRSPTLQLHEAFKLAKEKSGKGEKRSTKTSDTDEPKGRDKLRHLPPRPAIHGEKPSSASASDTQRAKPQSTRQAVERALEDLNVKFPGGN